MTDGEQRWARIEEIFHAATALSGEELATYLNDSCEGDAALRREVEALLRHAAETRDQFDVSLSAARERLAGGELAGSPEASMTGQRFGPYRIVRELGRGGMGRVFLAERDDAQYHSQVAIKLIATAASDSLQQRFRTERQVQADLQHPGIARLLDAGVNEAGESYLVMEYVDGKPIDVYCRQHRLSVPERLRLVVKLCDAVHHAHRNLVVHRDIKSTNVLVTAEGEAKLLDFGIAKLIDPQRASALALHQTAELSRVVTLDTASPEQLRGEPATTATDVYALGALLYRLLTGHGAFSTGRSDPVTVAEAILEREPPRPSQAVLEREDGDPDADSAEDYPAQLGSTPEKLSRALRGDLDTIILKALRKEPERRYDSAAELAADVERHLQRRPVVARGDSAGYVLRRFLVRHRKVVATAAAGLLAVISLAGFYTAELATERDRAQREARRAEEVSTFLTELFESATPEQSFGELVTARELLDLGAERIELELASEPAVQASLTRVIGSSYAALGFIEQATELTERALAVRESLGGPPDALLGNALFGLGNLRRSAGRYEESAALLDRALATRLEIHGQVHGEIAETHLGFAALHTARLEFDAAEQQIDKADAVLARMNAPDSDIVTSVLTWRGHLARRRGSFDEAVGHYRDALALKAAESGPDHPSTFDLRSSLAQVLTDAGRLEESEAMNRELLEMLRRVLPDGHPAIAVTLSALATSLKTQGRSAEAEPYQAESLSIHRAAHDGDHPEIVIALNNLANIRHDMRDLEGAYGLHHEALAMNLRIHGDDHPILANNYTNLAALASDMEDHEQALALYRQTLALDRAAFGDDHPFISHDMNGLGNALSRLGRAAEAEETLREALALSTRSPGPDHSQTAQLRRDLGIALTRQGRCDEAESLLRDALERLEQAFPADAWQTLLARAHLGGCLIALGSPEVGEPLLTSAYERLVETRGPDDGMSRRVRALWPEDQRPER